MTVRGREISIIGIDDYIGGNADYNKGVQNLKQTDTNIVLTHCLEHRDVISKQMGTTALDLVL